jgi:hypothetical protein
MSGTTGGAYELKHRGKIHRASGFKDLKRWVLESRVSAEDMFRAAGTEQWFPVMGKPEFAKILDPDNRWVVKMNSGEYNAHSFEIVARWAEEGRITDDAVVEGPRTPPGGVRAVALPALAPNLREKPGKKPVLPVIRFDGREYPAPDTETIRKWIKESRVPVEAEISLDGKGWEPVSSCGLFDLEDWPLAAHGVIEEEYLPEMPDPAAVSTMERITEVGKTDISKEGEQPVSSERTFSEISEITGEVDERVPFTVVSGNSETTVQSVFELKHLLRKKLIFSYDEIKHPSITEETLSVGEYLEKLRSPDRTPVFWILWGLLAAVVAVFALEYFQVLDIVTWLP